MALSIRHQDAPASFRLPPVGPGLTIAGCLLVVLGLWQPFYRLRFPRGVVDGLTATFGGADPASQYMGAAVTRMADTVNRAGGVGVDAWQIFSAVDIALLSCAVIAAVLMLVRTLGLLEPEYAWALPAAGVVGAGLVVFRMLVHPDRGMGMLSLDRGAWMLLFGCVLIAVGGWRSQSPA